MTSETDRAQLLARREALRSRLERQRRLELVQPVIEVLIARGIPFEVQIDAAGSFPAWPVVGNEVDWRSVPAATFIPVASDSERDAAFRSLLSRFAGPEARIDIVLANGDAPIVSLQSQDLATACGPILGGQTSLYVAAADESWLIEAIEGQGIWSGQAPA